MKGLTATVVIRLLHQGESASKIYMSFELEPLLAWTPSRGLDRGAENGKEDKAEAISGVQGQGGADGR